MYYNGIQFFLPVDLFSPALEAIIFRIFAWVGSEVRNSGLYYSLLFLSVHRKTTFVLKTL